MLTLSAHDEARFWSKVDQAANCWLWQGVPNSNGYGRFWWSRQVEGAHRVAWLITNGAIPPGLCVLHECDVPLCVNPDHLFLGTQLDNIADRVRKGRSARLFGPRANKEGFLRGEACPHAKLTEATVRMIRAKVAAGSVQRRLAAELGVHEATISDIVLRRRWRHVA